MNIYITRHSKTIWNQEKRLQGRKDSPLTQEGIENGYALKEYISNITFDCVYSSPIKRAYDTAKLISNQQIIIDDRLIEMDFGILEGKKIDEILKDNYSVYNNMWNHPELFDRIENGESYDEVQKRVKSFLDDLIQLDYENVLIVTHGMLFINMCAYMMKLERKDFVMINQKVVDGCSLTLFLETDGEYKKIFYGENSFLPHVSNNVFNK